VADWFGQPPVALMLPVLCSSPRTAHPVHRAPVLGQEEGDQALRQLRPSGIRAPQIAGVAESTEVPRLSLSSTQESR
jgi:hypothetical protein